MTKSEAISALESASSALNGIEGLFPPANESARAAVLDAREHVENVRGLVDALPEAE